MQLREEKNKMTHLFRRGAVPCVPEEKKEREGERDKFITYCCVKHTRFAYLSVYDWFLDFICFWDALE